MGGTWFGPPVFGAACCPRCGPRCCPTQSCATTENGAEEAADVVPNASANWGSSKRRSSTFGAPGFAGAAASEGKPWLRGSLAATRRRDLWRSFPSTLTSSCTRSQRTNHGYKRDVRVDDKDDDDVVNRCTACWSVQTSRSPRGPAKGAMRTGGCCQHGFGRAHRPRWVC